MTQDARTLLRARAADLGLTEEEADAWAERVDAVVVQAVLANLVRYEDALAELAR